MNAPPGSTEHELDDASSAHSWPALDQAVAQLRSRVSPRSVEVADDVLRNALRSSRRSLPVRAHPPYDYVRVSDQVLITRLRHEIDQLSESFAVGAIVLDVEPRDRLRQVTIELFVAYGHVLVDVADRVREVAQGVLADLLHAPTTALEVLPAHVHVSDVTVGNPHVVDS